MQQRRNLYATLLLDDQSRVRMKTNISDLSLLGLNIISELNEINENVLDKSRTIIILEDAMRKGGFPSEMSLYKEVWDLEYAFITLDEDLFEVMQTHASCYRLDPSLLDYDKVYGILYNDAGARRDLDKGYIESEFVEIAKEMSVSRDNTLKERKLAEAFLSLSSILSTQEKRIKQLHQEKERDSVNLQKAESYSNELESLYFNLLESATAMNRSLRQYEVILTKDIYTKVQLNRYPNRPKILYLKTYEDLIHMNSFIEVLYEMFKLQGRLNVKVLRLYDSSSSREVLALPTQYVLIQNEFVKRDVIVNDFIAKVGGHREILDIILTNHSGLDLLIIVDCKDHSDTAISGQSLQLALCRNEKHLPVYNLDPEMTVVNNSLDSELSWDHYPEYNNLSNDDRFLFLSSRPVMQSIFEMEKLFNNR